MRLTEWEIQELKSVGLWARGALAAIVGGVATAINGAFAAPETFNLSSEGLHSTLKLALGGAVLALAAYLKQSPLPADGKPAAASAEAHNVRPATPRYPHFF